MFTKIQTPCLILDRKIFDRNIQNMKSVTKTRDLVVRPHLKTAKCRDVARISASVFGPQATVSTLKEIACATAAAHDKYHVISDRENDIEIWERFGGW